jgi:hypothetical protein
VFERTVHFLPGDDDPASDPEIRKFPVGTLQRTKPMKLLATRFADAPPCRSQAQIPERAPVIELPSMRRSPSPWQRRSCCR